MKKSWIGLLLTLSLCVNLLPVPTIAAEKSNLSPANDLVETRVPTNDVVVESSVSPTANLTYQPEGETYSLTYWIKDDNTVEIAGCSGSRAGNLVIPDKIDGRPVTSIGNNAFMGAPNLTGELYIPAGVTYLGHHAFSGCTGLTGVLELPEGLERIENYAFSGCTGFTGELVIPKSVTSIGLNARSAAVPDLSAVW
ncbi:MAG: leucine-rich repeat domain-containing protein [Candidatus Pararuminococcus gallinarum]|jgi:hypothetical protein